MTTDYPSSDPRSRHSAEYQAKRATWAARGEVRSTTGTAPIVFHLDRSPSPGSSDYNGGIPVVHIGLADGTSQVYYLDEVLAALGVPTP